MRVLLSNWVRRWFQPLGRQRKLARRLAACAAVSLCTTWQPAAEAATVHLEVAPVHTLTQAYALYFNKNSSSNYRFDLGVVPGGTTTEFYHDFPDAEISDFEPSPPYTYSIVGVQVVDGEASAVFSFLSDWPAVQEATFDQLFTQENGYTEALFLSTLEYAPSLAESWTNRFRDIIGIPYGTQATLMSFSEAQVAGTALATVPEPGTWVLLVTGAGVLAVASRYRQRRCPR